MRTSLLHARKATYQWTTRTHMQSGRTIPRVLTCWKRNSTTILCTIGKSWTRKQQVHIQAQVVTIHACARARARGLSSFASNCLGKCSKALFWRQESETSWKRLSTPMEIYDTKSNCRKHVLLSWLGTGGGVLRFFPVHYARIMKKQKKNWKIASFVVEYKIGYWPTPWNDRAIPQKEE